MFGRKLNPFCDYQTDADFVTPDANTLKERMVEMSSVLFPAIGNLSKRSVNKAQLAFIKKFGKQISKDPFPVNSSVMIVDPVRSSKNEPYYLGPFKVLRRTKGGSYEILDSDNTLFPRNVCSFNDETHSAQRHRRSRHLCCRQNSQAQRPRYQKILFVKWKHYDSSYNSWVKASDFIDLSVINSYWSSVSPSNLGGG
ncbi:hypothetical protein BASA81_009959 [Batrachochytrium salamandrivorans]|nr:hypothetical protein BASA81_009959 [Batrachochytrium salamandrivorans]